MQNTSHAVMAQRYEPKDSLDDFPTPPWATRALFHHYIIPGLYHSVWEPSCNRGYMTRPLAEYFDTVRATDIHDYGCGVGGIHDFVAGPIEPGCVDWVITNPPFQSAQAFVERGLIAARRGVAILVRTGFIESKKRYRTLFEHNPPITVAQFVERVPMVRGRVDPRASSATSYAWLVWKKRPECKLTELIWIPPCRKALEREGDYHRGGAI